MPRLRFKRPKKTSPLYGETQRQVEAAWEHIYRRVLGPWRRMGDGHIRTRAYDGSEVSFQGVAYAGAPARAFWGGHVEPFLESAIRTTIDGVRQRAEEKDLDPAEPLDEARVMLAMLIERVYQEMQAIDASLRMGRGAPRRSPAAQIRPRLSAMLVYLESYASGRPVAVPASQAAAPAKRKLRISWQVILWLVLALIGLLARWLQNN